MYFVQVIVNGILLGSVYALLGVGMTMIFGIVKLTNLAHGEFVVLGAYLSTVLAPLLGIDPVLTLVFTVPLMFLTGFLLQYFLIGRAMKKGAEAALLVTFGLSIILQDGMLMIFTADARHIVASYSMMTVSVGALEVSVLHLVLFAISLVSILSLSAFLKYTHTGRAIRATSDDSDAAALSGVNISKVYSIAMGIAMASAAVAGLCVGMKWTYYPSSGGSYLLIAFVVVVIGGMGSVPGTMVAGVLFGLAQVIGGANYGLLISYVMLLIVLVIRPKGIFGK
ncbi:branched-chain amino acid ABC transporter permease [Ruminococcus sp.]|uniref:branched-chain amino acid ABC transporter permease n=1 Tax=Ruminococcus sp. TaxID=41978 RepID=UPI002E75AA2D|nr:branched-chain amino acid ABC transporter permease [Ruminococcus sp.]MEE1261877.1 branched-chain amino acid ABC transporter permease [Ruminococcus sp.]